MKMQIGNLHKVITGITFLVALLFITAFKAIDNMDKVQTALSSQTKGKSFHINIRILIMSDKVEVLKEFIIGWQEVPR